MWQCNRQSANRTNTILSWILNLSMRPINLELYWPQHAPSKYCFTPINTCRIGQLFCINYPTLRIPPWTRESTPFAASSISQKLTTILQWTVAMVMRMDRLIKTEEMVARTDWVIVGGWVLIEVVKNISMKLTMMMNFILVFLLVREFTSSKSRTNVVSYQNALNFQTKSWKYKDSKTMAF